MFASAYASLRNGRCLSSGLAHSPIPVPALVFWLLVCSASPVSAASPVSFRNDVMPALSKAGCNLGTCHGNARGKGGFQLSLRGQDPARDFDVLTRDWLGRRANAADPERSLLLLKPTMQLAHEGGQRFTPDSHEYRVLRDWIAAGLPADAPETPKIVGLDVSPTSAILEAPHWEIPLKVTGIFSDGSRRPLESTAVYDVGTPIVSVSPTGTVSGMSEGETVVLVRFLDQQVPVTIALIPSRPDFVWEAPATTHVVDAPIQDKLQRLKLLPAPACDDATFLRRASLDLTGKLPTAAMAQEFVRNTSPTKRAELVDELLQRPEFADWWALKWSDMLRVEEKTLDAKGTSAFHAWLRAELGADRPLDELVRTLITGEGSTYSYPPANFYRALRDPFSRSEAVGQLFLGVRLQCAKCHNHPFDRWTQDDYYSWGNVFARIDYKILENRRRDSNDTHEFDGEQIVFQAAKGDVPDPRTGKPRTPRFLGANAPELSPGANRLVQLGDWLTSADNDRFAQVLANRIWAQMLGRGLVEPVDDFRATNPPSHPELLQALATELRSNGYSLRHLLRLIATSQVYQRAAEAPAGNAPDESNYSHALVRRLTAEQLADALADATGVPLPYQGFPRGTRASQLPGTGAMLRRRGGPLAGDEWLRVNGRPQRLQSCECERSDETTLAQTFQLVSSDLMQQLVTSPNNRIPQLLRQGTPQEALEQLFWGSLSRAPTESERTELTAYLTRQPEAQVALQDILWSLLTSHEFLLRH